MQNTSRAQCQISLPTVANVTCVRYGASITDYMDGTTGLLNIYICEERVYVLLQHSVLV